MRSKATKNEAVGPAGLVTPRCQIWGVLNVTPDSFCDGGRYLQADAALQQGERLWRDGATVIDIGGASSRPRGLVYGAGADPVPAREEQARVVPVIEALAAQLPEACLSVDTCRAEVARAALAAGADIVNDISGGQSAALLDAVAAAEAEIVLMHNRGDGALDAAHTHYDDLWQTVQEELAAAATRAEAAGIDRARIWLDPGLGFAKTAPQSFALLAQLERW
ncbi:MAG: dihydropteroate synthase, partial [Polyangiales bacterium]